LKCEQMLPIGSVVRLNGGEKDIMIIGFFQQKANYPEVKYDYIAVGYPEGYLDMKLMFGFNHEDIEEVIFRGYEDENDLTKKLLFFMEMSEQIDEENAQE